MKMVESCFSSIARTLCGGCNLWSKRRTDIRIRLAFGGILRHRYRIGTLIKSRTVGNQTLTFRSLKAMPLCRINHDPCTVCTRIQIQRSGEPTETLSLSRSRSRSKSSESKGAPFVPFAPNLDEGKISTLQIKWRDPLGLF